jgi:nucleoid DNA-binding protein
MTFTRDSLRKTVLKALHKQGYEVPPGEVSLVIETVIKAIQIAVAEGITVQLRGLGTFKAGQRKCSESIFLKQNGKIKYLGHRPSTIRPTIKFKPSRKWISKINTHATSAPIRAADTSRSDGAT